MFNNNKKNNLSQFDDLIITPKLPYFKIYGCYECSPKEILIKKRLKVVHPSLINKG